MTGSCSDSDCFERVELADDTNTSRTDVWRDFGPGGPPGRNRARHPLPPAAWDPPRGGEAELHPRVAGWNGVFTVSKTLDLYERSTAPAPNRSPVVERRAA